MYTRSGLKSRQHGDSTIGPSSAKENKTSKQKAQIATTSAAARAHGNEGEESTTARDGINNNRILVNSSSVVSMRSEHDELLEEELEQLKSRIASQDRLCFSISTRTILA